LLRLSVLALVVILTVAAFFAWRAAGEPVHPIETPELRAAPGVPVASSRDNSGGGERGPNLEAAWATEMRIGSFEKPEQVPEYEVLESLPADRDGAHAARLLVDTRSRSEEDFTLIARDLKARYSDYDAVSAEFTDTSDVFEYNGAALIFNTPAGAYYIGYIFGPPNTWGYYVTAAE
jgi:hypothetical protein